MLITRIKVEGRGGLCNKLNDIDICYNSHLQRNLIQRARFYFRCKI